MAFNRDAFSPDAFDSGAFDGLATPAAQTWNAWGKAWGKSWGVAWGPIVTSTGRRYILRVQSHVTKTVVLTSKVF